jgi:hypothetical protein
LASIVDICNTALAHLGSDASISAIDPPDGSTEAGYCKRFYPIARRRLIESFSWPFATARVVLAEVTNDSDVWAYAYAVPADCIRPIRILTAGQLRSILEELTNDSDGAIRTTLYDEEAGAPYQREGDVLYTHEEEAVLLYLRDVTDPTKFSPTFEEALGYQLASFLAGPIIRGADGARTALNFRDMARVSAGEATQLAANQSREEHQPVAAHLAARA